MTLSLKDLLAKILSTPLVIETGTSGNWRWRKWSDGKVEAWGKSSGSIACTTASSAYGGYRSADIPFSIPSGIFSDTPDYAFGIKNGANSFRLMNVYPTSATQLNCYYSSAAKETNNVTVSFYVVKNS